MFNNSPICNCIINTVNYGTWVNIPTYGEIFPKTCDHQAVNELFNSNRIIVYGGGDNSVTQFNVPDVYFLETRPNGNNSTYAIWTKTNSSLLNYSPNHRLGECLLSYPNNNNQTNLIISGGYGLDNYGISRYLDI